MIKERTFGELQLHLGQLLHEYRKDGVCPAHFCIWEGKIQIRFCGHTSIQHPTFFKFTHYTFDHGLSEMQWTRLTQSIYNYVRRNEKCQKHSKHLTAPKSPHS